MHFTLVIIMEIEHQIYFSSYKKNLDYHYTECKKTSDTITISAHHTRDLSLLLSQSNNTLKMKFLFLTSKTSFTSKVLLHHYF